MGALKSYSWMVGFVVLTAGFSLFLMAPGQRAVSYGLMAAGALLVSGGVALNLSDLLALLRGRAVRYGANAVLYSLIVFLIFAAVNFLASRHRARIDLTRAGLHTLAPQTVQLLEGLEDELELIAFYREGNLRARQEFEDLLEEYRYHTDRLTSRIVDPVQSPGQATLHEIVQEGTIVVMAGEGKARITRPGEEALTNAIIQATRAVTRTVCFTTGHGEGSLADEGGEGLAQVAAALRRETYKIRDLLLLREPQGLADCDLLVVAGPTTAVHPGEAEAIAGFLSTGGRLMVLKRNPDATTGMEELLSAHGLKVNTDTIVDRLSRAIIGDEFSPVVTAYEDHPITRALSDSGMATYFPVASSVEAIEPTVDGMRSTVVARTSEAAWGESGDVARYDEGEDRQGPLGLVAAASGPTGREAGHGSGGKLAPERRLVLFGDSDFASNSYLGLSGNVDLFLNSVGWLAEEEDLISIRPRERSPQPITLTAARSSLLSGMTFLAPLAAFFGAALVWSRRKRL